MNRMNAGFTLIEAMVTLAVATLLLTVGIPSMAALVERMRVISAIESLTTHMALGRLSAITYRQPAVLCPSTTAGACLPGTDWSGGWMLFLDRDGNRRPDEDRHVLRADLAPVASRLRVVGTPGRPQLRYLPDGRSAGSNLTLSICSLDGRLLGSVVVNNAGRPRSERPRKPTPCPR